LQYELLAFTDKGIWKMIAGRKKGRQLLYEAPSFAWGF
jgi:hypothetical protein